MNGLRSPRQQQPTASLSPAPPRVRQTQRFAADRLLEALRKTTAIVPEGEGKEPHISVDEVLQLGASAVFGMSEEIQQQQREVTHLRLALAAAYRASAQAAADEISTARREADEAEARTDAAARVSAARERELETAVLSTHEQLGELQRTNQALQRGLERALAGGRLLEQRLVDVREAARSVMSAFPASAEEQAFEAERIKRIAAGDEAGVLAEGGSVDELSLLASALERGRRAAEQARCATAEAALLRAELAHEKSRAAAAADEQAAMIEAQRVALEERTAQLLETEFARDEAEEAARRFQALLVLAPNSPLSPKGAAAAISPAAPMHAAYDAAPSLEQAAALDSIGGLEAAVHEASSLAAMLHRVSERDGTVRVRAASPS